MFEALSLDARQAFRHLRRSPGFAIAAVLTLALGIGANTAMFSVLNALVFRPLPIRDPHGLVSVSARNDKNQLRLTPIPAVEELRRDGPLQPVCGYNGGVVLAVEVAGTPTQATGALVTGQCLSTFGIEPVLGRAITDDDAPLHRAGNRVAMISHRFWTRMLGANPSAIGKTISTEGFEMVVIGVLPARFGGLEADAGIDLFMPFDTIFPARADRRPAAAYILGRLRRGVTLDQAAAQLATRWPAILEVAVPASLSAPERAELRQVHPSVEAMGTGLSFLRDRYVRPLTIIVGLSAILLVLACINLGGLLMSRMAARTQEIGVRLALGGSLWRIRQQMLVESLFLSLSGAAIAVPLSLAIVGALTSFLPAGLVDYAISFTPDLRVLAVTALAGVFAGIMISALPVAVAARQHGTARMTWNRTIVGSTNRWARGLLVAQVALSVVLLTGAGLLVRSQYLLQQVDQGVERRGVIVVRTMPVPNAYRDLDNASYYPALLETLAALPGVRSAGYARMFPRLTGDFVGQPIAFVGDPAGDVRAQMEMTSPGFFETLRVPLIGGRFTSWLDSEKSQQVAVVSERLARMLSPDGDVIGRRVRFGAARADQDVVIVGVVRNATLGNLRQPDLPIFYRPALQTGRFGNYPSFVLATDGDPFALAPGVRQVLKDAGREYAHNVSLLDDILKRAPATERMSATIAGALAVLALTLAFIGVFSLLAYAVSRRTREIGVRVAIGATPRAMRTMVMREGFLLTLSGVAIGLPIAFLAARALRTLMFGVSESDPLTFGVAAGFFLALGLVAGIVPARRAVAVDPIVALRAE
jgi:predicted permease